MSSELGLFLAGAASGLAEGIVVQPFDMIKTRHQLNVKNNESVLKSFKSIYVLNFRMILLLLIVL
jgi:hypothetical protein